MPFSRTHQNDQLHNHLKGSVTQLVTFANVSQNRLCPLPVHYIVIRYPNRWYKWLFVTFRIHITNRLPMFPQHVFVILLWEILMSPLNIWHLIPCSGKPREFKALRASPPRWSVALSLNIPVCVPENPT